MEPPASSSSSSQGQGQGQGQGASDASWLGARLGTRDFKRLGALIEARTGIRMPPTRQGMLEGRLRQRLRALGLSDFGAYCEQVLDGGGDAGEVRHLIDRATTNTTQFFREPAHFSWLAREVLPPLWRAGRDEIHVWSAGCSTGEEAYTLAMVIDDASIAAGYAGLEPRIRATDISVEVLRAAHHAVYPVDRVAAIPRHYRTRYLLSSREREAPSIRIAASLRRRVTVSYLNLMDDTYAIDEPVDVLFCRNVFIYFDRPTQQEVLRRFTRHLAPGGHLFLGHVDTIQGLDVELEQVAPSVYTKRARR